MPRNTLWEKFKFIDLRQVEVYILLSVTPDNLDRDIGTRALAALRCLSRQGSGSLLRRAARAADALYQAAMNISRGLRRWAGPRRFRRIL